MKHTNGFTLALAALAVFGIHCLTVAEYPAAWFDEIEILDMGRFSIFDTSGAWSVNLIPQNGAFVAPSPYFHYLAGAVLEGLYRLTGTYLFGRLFMLASLPVCAFVLFGWLCRLGLSRGVAFATASLFLVDPNATICAHWYRPDLWCIVLMLTADGLIIRSREGTGVWRLLLAGALAAVSLCFWLSSVVLLPLLAVEVLFPNTEGTPGWRISRKCARVLADTALLSLGSLAALAVLLMPLYGCLPEVIGQYLTRSEVGSTFSAGSAFGAKVAANALAFAKIALRSPFSWLFALLGLLCARRLRGQAAAFLLVVAFMVATRVYHLRMAYLLPWIYLMAALALDRLWNRTRAGIFVRSGAVLALAFGFSVSVAALTYAAWPDGNTLAALQPRLKAAVPGTHPKVWLVDSEHECYHAGRALGWTMFSTSPTLGAQETAALREEYAGALDGMDAVVVSTPISEEGAATLRRHGFAKREEIVLPTRPVNRVKALLKALVYAHGYPTVTVWLPAHPAERGRYN